MHEGKAIKEGINWYFWFLVIYLYDNVNVIKSFKHVQKVLIRENVEIIWKEYVDYLVFK